MATTEDYAEAVIISGPRKGEFISVPLGEPELSPAETEQLETVVETARGMAENARAAAAEAEALLLELRQLRAS